MYFFQHRCSTQSSVRAGGRSPYAVAHLHQADGGELGPGVPTRFERGRKFPRDYTHVADVVQITIRALDVPASQLQDRIFYAATGRPLVTAGQVAEIVRSIVPGADIEIGSGLSEEDLVEIRYRGVLSIENARTQLGYEPRYADIREGIAEYIATYRRYLEETEG